MSSFVLKVRENWKTQSAFIFGCALLQNHVEEAAKSWIRMEIIVARSVSSEDANIVLSEAHSRCQHYQRSCR